MCVLFDVLFIEICVCCVCEVDLLFGLCLVVCVYCDVCILIVGQVLGVCVYVSGILWDDVSGKWLCDWFGVDVEIFYDEMCFVIVLMGFCYLGCGVSGDNLLCFECVFLWIDWLLVELLLIWFMLLIGQYVQWYFLCGVCKVMLIDIV